jgi:hypothetical protein
MKANRIYTPSRIVALVVIGVLFARPDVLPVRTRQLPMRFVRQRGGNGLNRNEKRPADRPSVLPGQMGVGGGT